MNDIMNVELRDIDLLTEKEVDASGGSLQAKPIGPGVWEFEDEDGNTCLIDEKTGKIIG